MKDESARDKAIENVLGQKLRDRAAPANGCPDAEILAAYFERTLPQKERAKWETHFDSCAACQQSIAAMVRMDEASEASITHPSAKPAPQPRKRFLLRWAWAAPVLLVVLAAGLWYTGEFDALKRHAETGTSAPTAVASAPKPVGSAAPANAQPGKATSQESKGEAPATQPSAAVPASAGKLDQQKQAANAPAASPSPAELGAVSAPGSPPPRAAMDSVTTAKEKDDKATAATAGEGTAGAPAPTQVEAAQAAPSAKRQAAITAGPQSEMATPSAAAAPVAASPPTPLEAAVMKKAEVAGGAENKTSRSDESQSATGTLNLFSRTRDLQGLARVAGFRYASSPGTTTSDGTSHPAAIWRIGRNGLIQKQTNQGQWETKPSGVTVDLLDISFPGPEVGWVVGQDGTVLRSANGGETWGRLAGPTREDLVSVRATSDEAAEVLTRSGVEFITTDGATTWIRTGKTR